MKSILKRLTRVISRPLEKARRKLAIKAEAFILSTLAKSTPPDSADDLLLAFMRASARNKDRSAPVNNSFQPLAFGPDRLLARHPFAEFVLVDVADLRPAALIATGDFERGLTRQLATTVQPGQRVWILGDYRGFHTLTASKLVGKFGAVVCIADHPCESRRGNLTLNRIENCVETANEDAHSSPDVIAFRIDTPDLQRLAVFQELADRWPQATLIVFLTENAETTCNEERLVEAIAQIADSSRVIFQGGLRPASKRSASEPELRIGTEHATKLMPVPTDVDRNEAA